MKLKKILLFSILSIFFLAIIMIIINNITNNSEMQRSQFTLNTNTEIDNSNRTPKGLGVNINGSFSEYDIEMMQEIGVKWARIDLTWSNIERAKGIFDFESYDRINTLLKISGIKPYFILDYSNELYEKDKSIVTEEGRHAFAKYASVAAKRYKDQNAIWEIWNEPNLKGFWSSQPSVESYSLLVKKTAPAIKEADPSGFVVAPAVSEINEQTREWINSAFTKGGILDYIDAVSVHPYPDGGPEKAIIDYKELELLIKMHTQKSIPIISGEWGYSTTYHSEIEQAKYLTRMFLINYSLNIPVSIWFNWKEQEKPKFGIVKQNLKPKLSYYAMKTLTSTLKGYEYTNKIKISNPNDYLLKFVNNEGEVVIVMWTVENNHDTSLPLKHVKGQVITMLGKKKGYYNSDINPYIGISDKPIYLIVE